MPTTNHQMASTIPYTYFQCPCTAETIGIARRGGEVVSLADGEEGEDEGDFDPRAPRANYSLYPLEHLLYCEDCQEIRCPRCVLDEIVTWFCPNCLFEVPSSTVKSEGNRCTRSCFQCPCCTSPLSVASIENHSEGALLGSEHAAQAGPWVLSCAHCSWSSKEIGIKFDKPNSIYTQLSRIKNGGVPVISSKDRRLDRDDGRRNVSSLTIVEGLEDDSRSPPNDELDPEVRFSNLRSFYQSQFSETATGGSLSFAGGDYGYGSPGALSRIMGLYTGGSFADKKPKSKPEVMREAEIPSEGFAICSTDDSNIIQRLETEGWTSTASIEQRKDQPSHSHFITDLRPVPYLLRTKRSKRCKTCRHILSKPEAKVQTTRFRIRLVALNYIPSMTITTLPPTPMASPAAYLQPLKPTQFLLTLKNPLFDPVKITLATTTHTPGRISSKVTILCPQFDVGANTDVWDEALQEGGSREKRRTKTETVAGVAEAGKVWERGRNWASVVVEVVPGSLVTPAGKDGGALMEDEDILEISVFVRVEWETDAAGEDVGKEREAKEKRELAYWTVLGVGRIAT